MESCTEQMLEMEQTDEVYRAGRALRAIYRASALDAISGETRDLLQRLRLIDTARPAPHAA